MSGPSVAIAASTRPWGDQLHRFVLDHGGATVKARVMSVDQATSADFDVLVIDDICSFLTRRLIVDMRRLGRGVIGVFAPGDGPDAKRRLLEVGISDVIDSDASPSELLEQVRLVDGHRQIPRLEGHPLTSDGLCLAITGPPGGVGITEIALGIATQMRGPGVALVDLNQQWAAVGQRLGLPVHPNLRTAVDSVLHDPDRLSGSFHRVGEIDVVVGLVNPDAGVLTTTDASALISELADTHDHVIIDVGTVTDWATDMISRCAHATLIVGLGDPIGITRLIKSYWRVSEAIGPTAEIGLIVNRVRSKRERGQILDQISRSIGPTPVFIVPEVSALSAAAWNGFVKDSGAFARSVRPLASLFQNVGRP